MEGQKYFGGTIPSEMIPVAAESAPVLKATSLWLDAYRGHNSISIIIPCHRVVGANGSLTGYAGGLDKKLWPLEHEGVDTSRLFRPTKGTAL